MSEKKHWQVLPFKPSHPPNQRIFLAPGVAPQSVHDKAKEKQLSQYKNLLTVKKRNKYSDFMAAVKVCSARMLCSLRRRSSGLEQSAPATAPLAHLTPLQSHTRHCPPPSPPTRPRHHGR